jgi:glutathione-regulated potassium-efflux system ancillary protein KefG
VLVIYVHPVPHRSRVNGRLADAARRTPGVTFHDLYEQYPEAHIDVEHEQRLVEQHPVVVFQHPMYWYSTPALLKDWQDHVLEYGWAYGRGGVALRGKWLLTAISTGGPAVAYDGRPDHPTVRALLEPIAHTARLCGMRYLPPLVQYGAHRIDDTALRTAENEYAQVLGALRDERLDPEAVRPDGSLDVARALAGVHGRTGGVH